MPSPPLPTLLSALSVDLPVGTPPEWLRLVPAGKFGGTVDDRTFELKDVAALAACSSLPLPVDFDHAIDRGPANGQSGAACGWVEAVQPRPDGLYGRIAWNDLGLAALSQRHYRYLSPVIAHQPDGTVTSLRRVALTNNPAVPELQLLSAQTHPVQTRPDEARMSLSLDAAAAATLRGALGVAADAPVAALLSAATKLSGDAAALGQVRTKLGVTAPDLVALLGALDARIGGDGTAIALLSAQLATTQADLKAIKDGAAKTRIDDLVRKTLITEDQASAYLGLLNANPQAFEVIVGGLLPKVQLGEQYSQLAAKQKAGDLSADEAKIISKLGLSKVAFLKTRDQEGV
jgi:phage I-like protein